MRERRGRRGYVGLKERCDVQVMDYGFPGWGPRRLRWGWPGDVDVWKIPCTDSTLVVDIIDGQTNQLITTRITPGRRPT